MSWLGRCSESLLTLDLTDCVALDTQVCCHKLTRLTHWRSPTFDLHACMSQLHWDWCCCTGKCIDAWPALLRQAARAITSCSALTWLSLAGCTQVNREVSPVSLSIQPRWMASTQSRQIPTLTLLDKIPVAVLLSLTRCLQLDDVAVTRVLSGTWRLHVLRLDRLWRLTNAVIVGLDDLFGLRDLSMSACKGAVRPQAMCPCKPGMALLE